LKPLSHARRSSDADTYSEACASSDVTINALIGGRWTAMSMRSLARRAIGNIASDIPDILQMNCDVMM
jgi:hypothetical protein